MGSHGQLEVLLLRFIQRVAALNADYVRSADVAFQEKVSVAAWATLQPEHLLILPAASGPYGRLNCNFRAKDSEWRHLVRLATERAPHRDA